MVIKTELGVEAMDDKEEEFKSLMKPYFEEMTKQLMQGFELLASQLGSKLETWSSSSSHHEEKKTYGETIFSKIGIQNWPRELNN